MEQIEQLIIMYKVHEPGIWTAVREPNLVNLQRLLKAMVKCNPRRNNQHLIDFVCSQPKIGSTQADKICQMLRSSLGQTDLVHAMYSCDRARIESILSGEFVESAATENASYAFSWYTPVYRNLSVSLLEIAFDTRDLALVETVLTRDGCCDVNALSSRTGDPFYFRAFETEYAPLKSHLLRTSNLRVKNYHGQSVLFHLVKLYERESTPSLVEDFYQIVKHSPALLTARDQNQLTLVEWIIMSEEFTRVEVFLRKISSAMIEFVNERNFRVFQDMINHSYGLILLNTPIYTSSSPSSTKNAPEFARTVTFEYFILEQNMTEMRSYLKRFYDMDFFRLVNKFEAAIKSGDMNTIRELLTGEKFQFLGKLKDPFGRTCLHLAILYNQKSLVK